MVDKTFGGVSGEKLRMIVSKIEKLEQEKKEVAEYVSEAYSEAKSLGFDVKILRQVIKLRKMDEQKISEQEDILDLYKHALGMIKSGDE